MDLLTTPSGAPSNLPWQVSLLSTLLAFILSQCIALTYERTYEGMSYSRALFQTLALASVISCTLMFTIGNNLARGIGIAGIFAIIRFRTNLRDPRDITFVFASLSIGVACGIMAYSLAITATAFFVVAAFYLKYVPLGTRKHFDGVLRLQISPDNKTSKQVLSLLKESCRSYSLLTLRDVSQGQRLEYAYQIKLLDNTYKEALVHMLRDIPDVFSVHLLMQETTVEL